MKQIASLLIGVFFVVSCGKNKEEQMLYNYQQENAKALNFNLDDLNFEIKKIEKVADITASDTIKELKKELAGIWTKKPKQSLIDTISFSYLKDVLNDAINKQDTLYKAYQESVMTAIRIGDVAYKYESKRKRDNALDEKLSYQKTLSKVNSLEKYHRQLSKKPDSVLSSKYVASYTQNNPMLGNAKQTFDKVFYTDSKQTRFIKSEPLNPETE
ncbi:hypothetical protein ACFSTE_04005 [Aquimarina hainanensis]|uniref:Lipoprotein n=1 Tax=Aquimarina hainanensis TaxID=1578017 RepID=A0ABW5N619_9FLAO